MLAYDTLGPISAGNKKWISAAAIADKGDSVALLKPPTFGTMKYGIAIGAATLTNRSGSNAHAGLAGRFPASLWAAGQVTAAGAYTADTDDAQDEGTNDFSMHDRADSGSGFLVSCAAKFNILGIVQGVAGDQTTPVLVLDYWNGSSWVDIAASCLIADAINGTTGEKIICFPEPPGWVIGGSGTGVPAAAFNLRVRTTHSGAGTADPSASQMFVGYARVLVDTLASPSAAVLERAGQPYHFPPQCDALFPLFSVASIKNMVDVDVRLV